MHKKLDLTGNQFTFSLFQLWQWWLVSPFASSNIFTSGHGGWAWRRWWQSPYASCPRGGLLTCNLLWTTVYCNTHTISTRGNAANASSPSWRINQGLPVWHSKANVVNVWIRHMPFGRWKKNNILPNGKTIITAVKNVSETINWNWENLSQ